VVLETAGDFSNIVIVLESRKPIFPPPVATGYCRSNAPIVKLLGGDTARRIFLNQATVRPGHRVLDIGCGKGALAVLIKRLHPGVDVVGLDPDQKALARTKRKAVLIRSDPGFSHQLPYPDPDWRRIDAALSVTS
jgi:ubiquinone/menaquinone biosynthesis C-methylase UbiE